MKIKSLPSSQREKKRYLAFAVECDFELGREEAREALMKSTLKLLGEVGASKLSMQVFTARGGYLIVACNHLAVEKIMACAALVGEYKGKKMHLRCLGVSGTLRALRKKFLRQREDLLKARERQVDFKGKTFTVAREDYNRLDLVPCEEFLNLAEKTKVKYIGITQYDLRGD